MGCRSPINRLDQLLDVPLCLPGVVLEIDVGDRCRSLSGYCRTRALFSHQVHSVSWRLPRSFSRFSVSSWLRVVALCSRSLPQHVARRVSTSQCSPSQNEPTASQQSSLQLALHLVELIGARWSSRTGATQTASPVHDSSIVEMFSA